MKILLGLQLHYLLFFALLCAMHETAKIGIYTDNVDQFDKNIISCLQKYLASSSRVALVHLPDADNPAGVVDLYSKACSVIESGMDAHVTYASCETVAILDSIFCQYAVPHISLTSSNCDIKQSETTIQRTYTDRPIVLRLLFDIIVRADWDFFYLFIDDTTDKEDITTFLQNLTAMTVSVRIMALTPDTNFVQMVSSILHLDLEPVIVVMCETTLINLFLDKTKSLQTHQHWHDVTLILINENLNPPSYLPRWGNGSTALLIHLDPIRNRDMACLVRNTDLQEGLPTNMTIRQSLLVEALLVLAETVAINNGMAQSNRTCTLPLIDKQSTSSASSIISSFKNRIAKNQLFPLEDAEKSLQFNLTVISRTPVNKNVESHTSATWTPTSGLQLLTSDVFSLDFFDKFGGRRLQVVATAVDEFIDEPYVMRCKEGNETYCGLVIDILKSMAEQLNFTYDLKIVKTVTGVDTGNGSWNGVIGILQREEADLGIGPISVTAERASVVDFTYTFLEDRAAIMLRTPKESLLLRVFAPFSLETWLVIFGIALCTPPVVWFADRCSPYAGKVTEYTRRKRNIVNVFWQLYTAYNRQSCEFRQKSVSSRSLIVIWVLYTIVMDSMYTAVLTAILTVSVNKLPINNIHDLAENPYFKVTFLDGSNLASLFQESTPDSVYGKINENIKSHGLPMPSSVPAAEKLMDEDESVVYITDSLYLKYAVGAYPTCLKYSVAPGTFNPTGLAFIAVKDGPYTRYFSKAIIKLQEGGFIEKWRAEYWRQDDECLPERTVEVSNLEHFSGAYGLLGAVIALAIVAIVAELIVAKMLLRTSISQQANSSERNMSTTVHANPIFQNTNSPHLTFSKSLNISDSDVLY